MTNISSANARMKIDRAAEWSCDMDTNPFREEYFLVEGDILTLRIIDAHPGEGDALPFYWWSILLRSSGQKVGKISLRLGHNYHSYYNGNVGYEVDEECRGHHYALIACRMVAQIARRHGMGRLYFTCDQDNVASYRTIEGMGAKLIETVTPPNDYIFYYKGIPPHRIYLLEL